MQLDRQDYKDGTIELAVENGYDCVQLKYDGWWCRLTVAAGEFTMHSRTNRLVKSGAARPGFEGTFIGEYMFGTNWAQHPTRNEKLFLFDCWGLGKHYLSTATYRDRYMLLKTQAPYLPDWMSILPVYPISQAQTLWKEQVENGEYEGLVFRRRLGTIDDVLMRVKRTVTADFIILGFEPGEGKHAGRLGALLCGTKEKPTEACARVGNGFSEALREEIWANQGIWYGRWIECSGKGLFESTGLLRHPSFERLRPID